MSLRLAIEISNPSSWESGDPMPGIAVGEVLLADGIERLTIFGSESVDPTRQHDDDLMPAIHRLCSRLGVMPNQLRSIAVSIGPGGFTATRLAVTTAKCLAAVIGADCIGVPSAAVAVRNAMSQGLSVGTGEILVLMAAKAQSVFAQRWHSSGKPVDHGVVVDAAVLEFENVVTVLADRFALAAIETRITELQQRGIGLQRPCFTPQALLEASLGSPSIAAMRLLPLYPREPEAVTKWRALKAAGKK